MKTLILSLFLILSHYGVSQNVEIQGSAKITNMNADNSAGDIVVRQTDGTLATRTVSSLPPNNPIDTTRNLASDFELMSHICSCGSNLPPMMIKSLLASGYSEEDLLDAGVPFLNISNSKPVLDGSGNEYSTIEIGSQTWLRENLKTTKFNDGTDIPLITSNAAWIATNTTEDPAYCWFNNDIANKDIYGALYNWYAISATTNGNKEVCPIGWRAATLTDYTTLKDFLVADQGGKLKETGYEHWAINIGASNESGFTALPAGYRVSSSGNFSSLVSLCNFWINTEATTTNGRYAATYNNSAVFGISSNDNKRAGLSMRCIRN